METEATLLSNKRLEPPEMFAEPVGASPLLRVPEPTSGGVLHSGRPQGDAALEENSLPTNGVVTMAGGVEGPVKIIEPAASEPPPAKDNSEESSPPPPQETRRRSVGDEEPSGDEVPAALASSPAFEPTAIIDGTKLIINTKQHQPFQVDNSLRIIFSSSPLRRTERTPSYSTYVSDAPETLTVIDSALASHVFLPIVPALHGGVIYTRDGLAHVVVPGSGDIKRSKISSKQLPHKVCNKFVAAQHFLITPIQKVMPGGGSLSNLCSRFPSEMSLTHPWHPALSQIPHSAAAGGIVYVRMDASAFRFTIASPLADPPAAGDAIEFHDGRATAWSTGVDFRFQTHMWCCRRVTGAGGQGTIWVDNPRQAPSNPPTAFAA